MVWERPSICPFTHSLCSKTFGTSFSDREYSTVAAHENPPGEIVVLVDWERSEVVHISVGAGNPYGQPTAGVPQNGSEVSEQPATGRTGAAP